MSQKQQTKQVRFVVRIILYMLGLWVGCVGQKLPEEGLTEEAFVALCVDVLALQSDSVGVADRLGVGRGSVFQAHGISRDEVIQFLAYRKAHPETWESVVRLFQARLDEPAEVALRAFQDAKRDSPGNKKAGP
jgi:hypothetical protein